MYTFAEMRQKIASDPRWCERAILAIYKGQTASEKQSQTTHIDNGIGFNGADATILSSFAEQLLQGKHLSEKQLRIGFKKIVKYAGQLAAIAGIKIEKIKGHKGQLSLFK